MFYTDYFNGAAKPTTLVQLLNLRAKEQPNKLAYRFLDDGDAQESLITYAELDQRARAIAVRLQDQIQAGDRILLFYPPGLDYIAAYFGCLYAGAIAVTVFPPRLNRPAPRLQAIIADSGAMIALTPTGILKNMQRRFKHNPDMARLSWFNTDEIPNAIAGSWREPVQSSETIAFLQYTSGSTSSPKGVIITHGNLIHNMTMISYGFQIDLKTRAVFWLPIYHDMGLIGGILVPMYVGVTSTLMSPASFLQRPLRWLQAITRYKATISGAPNFAYQMCLDRITPEQRAGLDLSSWRVAFSGAEPIRTETLRRFSDTFGEQGFQSSAFYPCYGLAEATLLVSGGEGPSSIVIQKVDGAALSRNRIIARTDNSTGAQEVVSCGGSLLDQEIVIVNPDTHLIAGANEVGEIWVNGPSVAQGYWQQNEATLQTFGARMANSNLGPYLRTGDLGFIQKGQLYITGRLKDLIIIRGRNHYPQDIEYTIAESHPSLDQGLGAAFSIEKDGEERLVVVYEMTRSHRKPNMEAIVSAVRRAVAKIHELQLYALILVKPLSIPKTSSGKIKRFACKEGFLNGSLKVINHWHIEDSVSAAVAMQGIPGKSANNNNNANYVSSSILETWLVSNISAALKIDPQTIDVRQPFIDYGLDSVQAVSLAGQLESLLNRSLSATLVWDYPTIHELASFLALTVTTDQNMTTEQVSSSEPVAIVGLGIRFPGADSPDAFWQMLASEVDAIHEVPAERWDADAFYDPNSPIGKMNTRWGGFLERIDEFDPQFFGISPREAVRIDPQQRLILEVVWEALENSGQAPTKLAGSNTAVFIGISSYDYSRFQFSDPRNIDIYAGTGNAHSIAANRLSYLLDLRGPSVAVDTACSSSLVAVHLACQSLRLGETDLAIAGGVNLILSPEMTILFSQGRVMAGDGRCKTFDARADGYVRGEGCGVVILKRLSTAIRDKDQVLAVIRGSAVNQDGRSNGLTAPNGRSQQSVIQQALANANTLPAEISYVEAHGTGTPLGDPIEIHSLRAVYDNDRSTDQTYSVGSVKTNIGHLEAAAGIAGLIKVVLSLHHEQIPAQLHFKSLNPHIDLTDSPLRIAAQKQPWPRGEHPRTAGVSSFGFGGTNAHIIIGDPRPTISNEKESNKSQISNHLLTISAKREETLMVLAIRYRDYIAENSDVPLPDICYTANNGRSHFDYRLAITGATHDQMAKRLQAFIDGRRNSGLHLGQRQVGRKPKIAFLFTSPGAQYRGMGKELYESQPVFRAAVDRCATILEEYLDVPLLQILYPGRSTSEITPLTYSNDQETTIRQTVDDLPHSNDLIHNLAYTQLALFALEYALFQLWRSWGIEPDVVMGHSMGEYVAACVAGVFSLEEGLRLMTERGRLMQASPNNGMMASVYAQEAQLKRAMKPYRNLVSIAALNSPGNVVLSGEETAVLAVLAQLEKEGFSSQQLTISQASHSPMMEPVLDEFESFLNQLDYQPTVIPFVSNLTGKLHDSGALFDASHWRRHLRDTVRFTDGVQALAEFGTTIFVEIGPDPSLLTLARRCLPKETEAVWLPSLRRKRSDWQVILNSLGAIYAAGLSVNWQNEVVPAQRYKVALPTYPFSRQRYWLDVGTASRPTNIVSAGKLTKLPAGLPIFELEVDTGNGSPLSTIYEDFVKQAIPNALGSNDHVLKSLDLIDQPAPLNGRMKLQVIFIPETADGAEFKLFSHDADEGTWHLRAHGHIHHDANGTDSISGPDEALTQAKLLSLPDDERSQAVIDFLIELTARVLDLDREQMTAGRPLDTLGLDSLMALELKTGVEQSLGIPLPIVDFLQGPTLMELSTKLLDFATAPESEILAIAPVSEPGQSHPLSFNQQALWFLHELLPENVSFNVAGAVRIRGSINVGAWRSAFEKLIQRHPVLRTTFTMSDGQPTQKVQAAINIPFQEINALEWDEDVLVKYLTREAYSPFDLEKGPIIKMRLLKRPKQEYVLLLAMDHIIIDLWSISVMIQELYQLYLAELSCISVDLPQLSIQYTDYIYWERELLASAEGERQRSYWQKQLGGELPVLDLPTDRPRSARQTYVGDTVNLRFDSDLTVELRATSQKRGATLYMTLLAAFQTLLHRYTGQDKLLVGSVLAGRERPELAQQIGYYINPVAMKADFSNNPGFETFLDQVRQTVLEAFANSNYPLPLLADSLHFVRDPSRPPLFETMFIMQKAQILDGLSLSSFAPGMPKAVVKMGDFTAESITLPQMPAQFDLTLMIAEMDGGLGISFHYNSDLFDRDTMERMLVHFKNILGGIIADPKQPVSSIPLLSVSEREQLTLIQTQTKKAYPADQGIHHLVEMQTRQTPDAVAVICDSNSVTFDQLNRRANQLAHFLKSRGTSTGQLVGICVDRSIDMVVGLLGILKAGGAYIPLDPSYPEERLDLMLTDAQPHIILTQHHIGSRLPILTQSKNAVYLDDSEPFYNQPETDLDASIHTENLAYLIYTSGSTGRPKGVMVSHRNVINFLRSMRNEPGLTAQDTLLAITTLSFDIAVLELFLPLSVGAKLVIAARAEVRDGLRLQKLLSTSKATVMQATPATWQLLLEAGWEGNHNLRILCGGEALPRDLANRLLQRSRELWNMYGPTETTIWSTIFRVHLAEGPVPIGSPISNTQLFVLDKEMQPVPQGVVGDLYIAGDGVTQGYYMRPKLNAAKFIAHSFDKIIAHPEQESVMDSSSIVLYKTDDKVRLLSDGNLMFLGRNDNQVKLRGHRIELGDIESALGQYYAVNQVAVVIRSDRRNNKLIIAYLVLHKDADPVTVDTLRTFSRHKLPDYMIPSAFIILNEFPLTPNGKIDRRALPTPIQSRPALNAAYVSPRTSLEKQLAQMCIDILDIDKVGIYDNFFDLGGNSLLATQLIFRVRETLQVQVPLHYLFSDSTVAGLSKAVVAVQTAQRDTNSRIEKQPSLFEDMTVAQLNAEAILDTNIPDPDLPLAAIRNPKHIFLTGATGFVGAFLLHDLITKTDATIHCLVRADSVADGNKRLHKNLARYKLWQDRFTGRFDAVPGNLTQQLLGLSIRQYQELTQKIDVIYHNGATVNFVHSYQTHKGSNVLGTQEILRLAGTDKLKAVHFVSTLSVLHTGAHDDGSIYFENDKLEKIGVPFGGYAKSKWVAEKLVAEAGRRGVPVAIFRPGLISGHSDTGVTNTADMISSLLRASLTTGTMPDLDVMIDIIPVNYISEAIVYLSLQTDFANQVFHLSNPRRMPYDEMTAWFKSSGYKVEPIPFAAWRDNLINLAAQLGGGGWDAFLPLLEEAEAEQAFMPVFDCQNSLDGLAGSDISCAPVNGDLLQKYLTYFKNSGYI